MPARKKITTIAVSPTITASESKKTVKETNQISNLEQLKIQVAQQINALFDLLIKEVDTVEIIKKKTQEELELQKRQRKQEEEEQNFNILLTQKKKQAEFDEKLDKDKKAFTEYQRQKEEELTVQKESLDKQEKEYKELKNEVESFPQKLGKTIEETKKQITAELRKDFETENKLLTQKYESGVQLLEQQIVSLQTQIKQLDKESQSLKDEKTSAVEQVKEIAIAVVKGKEKDLQTQASE
ncbi:hypothetical protein A3F03_05140 [Candidatus Roizmanbacteria bacterium RIFCSPHIGHO2_12_FULL_41_11]|uniref:Uncharacterized protein n=2 Tax=Candidatus Roizmaniibacteriota TaxID=1752723 RepID=A0A1F7JRH4_9BACT|nr:MAG: hypothetical protein A3F03_05140 [Candidatus Roizmanbacteria bacterium RIFCSPHIGHO2_12_FULL_41_11]OGK58216.1 MAG: hypothetical protein A3H86_02870 [Candidatus Roizmanbacteria bacterium RIFCSPLOWO2_02_FULL_41_9]